MVLADTTFIGFMGLKVQCLIGILPRERIESQEISISLKMALPQRNSTEDALSSTIDYTQLATECRLIATSRCCGLLETLATSLIECIFDRYGCTYAWVRIEKPMAIADAACAFIEHEKRYVCDGL